MTALAEEHDLAIEHANLLREVFHDLGLALMDWQHPADPIGRLEDYLPKGESCSDSC